VFESNSIVTVRAVSTCVFAGSGASGRSTFRMPAISQICS
jgi:hypothetical protein